MMGRAVITCYPCGQKFSGATLDAAALRFSMHTCKPVPKPCPATEIVRAHL
jgi:hypothetical protein